MNLIPQKIKSCYVIETKRFDDNRGYFKELFNSNTTDINTRWLQTNCSVSHKNVIRGIHITPFPKLISVVRGKIFDVVVDMRPNSMTYKQWVGEWLSEENGLQMYVPSDCGHAFYVAEDDTTVVYMQGGNYSPSLEKSIKWNSLDISWPEADEYILSEKDA